MKKKFINSKVEKLNPYIPPIFENEGIRLYMNENIFGASPKCLNILKNIQMKDLIFYPYGGDEYLKKILKRKLNIKEENICFNNGSASSIQQICMGLLDEGDKVLIPNPGWSYYKSAISSVGAIGINYNLIIKEDEINFNIESIINEVKKLKIKMLIITSPNMPTGNIIKKEEIKELLLKLENTIIILDEAYYGFYDSEINIKELLIYENFLDIRTFSKFYGLASLRIGYLLGHKNLVEEISKIAPLFGITYISQILAGEALKDEKYYFNLKSKINEIRDFFITEVNKLESYYAYNSKSNFILIDVKKHNPEEILKKLKEKGYLVRDCKGYKLYHHIRVTIGLRKQMEEILTVLKGI